MKKAMSLIVMGTAFFMSTANAQVDTTPLGNKNSRPMDTIPALDTTTKKWNMDSLAKDQLSRKDSGLGTWRQDTLKRSWDSTTNTNRLMKQSDSMLTERANADTVMPKLTDRVVMKDGAMYVIKNGETEKLEKDITMPSGQVITADGTVKKKDGTSVKLKDGQYIEMKTVPVKKETTAPAKKEVKKDTLLKKSAVKKKAGGK